MAPKKHTPPPHLTAAAKAKWIALAAEYNIADEYGVTLLTTAMEAFDRATSARELLARDGAVVRDSRGSVKAHPAAAIERDARVSMLSYLRALNIDVGSGP